MQKQLSLIQPADAPVPCEICRLDVLETSKNHDVKQSMAIAATAEDWIFALVSAQTGGAYNVQNGGCIRTANLYAPRLLMGLAPPVATGRMSTIPSLGGRFRRDCCILLTERQSEIQKYDHVNFKPDGGVGLTWQEPWPVDAQLVFSKLDIWFIEVCRRVRLRADGPKFLAFKKSDKKYRIDGKDLAGRIGDPWTPEHKTEKKGFSLYKSGFDYKTLSKVLFGEAAKSGYSHDWILPTLLESHSTDSNQNTLLIVAEGLAGEHGKSGTNGFHTRTIPISGKVAASLGPRREELYELARAQITEISGFKKALRDGLALYALGGDFDKLSEALKDKKKRDKLEVLVTPRQTLFDRAADTIFFPHLWERFEAQDAGEAPREQARRRFQYKLKTRAEQIFDAALPTMPCAGIFRPRAEARARSAFRNMLKKSFPLLFETDEDEVRADAS